MFPPHEKALICGVSGQDGAYLAKLLLEKGYHVIGTSRDAQGGNFANLDRLSIADQVERQSMVLTDFRSTLQTIAKANRTKCITWPARAPSPSRLNSPSKPWIASALVR